MLKTVGFLKFEIIIKITINLKYPLAFAAISAVYVKCKMCLLMGKRTYLRPFSTFLKNVIFSKMSKKYGQCNKAYIFKME